ncbi:hypothetical protein AN639_01245 [Candidatus Epulonipiscium fishelsonii]|uniref:Uncharacterized protein n=1 Tax=Candidatus Epulonipiscium fishelsonii TaxID=77094 RepID=A0ACC8X7W6_9FIRM|nr:hypothetical protein AN396_11995 [Epulopiscium sp. SCG-B11WGA-EpuloA1]ONI40734.1 hypothetical protein AN639_01245 [Epulopiscium sp. SCG-B05WGA-EpuloA1]
MKPILTIFTPTYNRAYILHQLYNSLCEQNNLNFIWLIVDDGSTDNTRELINKWLEEKKLSIKYIYQPNQGKHIAWNTAIDKCTTELFYPVDSDDYLLSNAVENIYDEEKYIKDKNIIGILGLKITKDREPLGKKNLPCKIKYISLSELYEKYKFKGETSLVFKSGILKNYLFPKIKGEKFIGEEYVYCQIDRHYKYYLTNKTYYIAEYLQDGYTSNMHRLIANNPRGYMLTKYKKLQNSTTLKVKYKSATLYIVGAWLCNEKHYIKKSPNKFITILAFPLAILVYFKRFYIIKNK